MVSLQASVALATIGVYIAIILAIGYRGWQIGTLEVDDWMVASRDIGLLVLLFTFAATYTSAFAFLGVGGFIYGNGIGIFGAAFVYVLLSGLILWVLGSRIWLLGKKYGYITPADIIRDLYNSELLARLVSLTLIVVTFPYIAIQMIGSGLIFETASAGLVSFEVGAGLLLLVGILYVWLGGLRAVAWTDTVQGVFLFGAMWLAGWVFVFTAYQGPVAFWTQLSENFAAHLTLPGPAGLFTPAFYVSFWFTVALGVMMLPHIFLRYVAARSPRVLKWTGVFGAIYPILFYIPAVFLAFGAVVAFPDLASPDSAIPKVLFEFTPVWFASITVAGAIAAAMSTADSQLHAISALIARDWYEPLAGGSMTEQTVTRLARLLVPLLGSISYVIAIQRVEFIIDLATVSFYSAAQVFPILVGGLVWARASRLGALWGFVLGVVVTVTLQFNIVSLPASAPGFVSGFYGLLVNTTIFGALSILVNDSHRTNVDRIQGYLEYATTRQWEAPVHDDD